MYDNKHVGGLKPLSVDPRDRSLGAAFRLPPLSELPSSFRHVPLSIKDQGVSDLCTAYATCGASELQEGVELCPEYSFAVTKDLMGDPEEWGADLRVAMKSHVKVGAIEKGHISAIPAVPRRLSSWPADLKDKAVVHAKGSFMEITGPYDHFDNIRAAIWLFRNEKRAVPFGVRFGWPLDQIMMNEPNDAGEGHAMYAVGWDLLVHDDYLVVVGSAGRGAGSNGIHYFSRSIINKYVALYGAYMFADLTKEEYLARIKPRIEWSIVGILRAVKQILAALVKEKQTALIPVPPVPVTKVSRLADWAKAIERIENMKKFYPGHNNPGALRYSRFQTGVKDGYATFATYTDGWNALMFQLRIACDGRSQMYSPTDTLLDFFKKYAPSKDRNNPDKYAADVALMLDVPIDIQIKELM
ncbi:MAG: hypothetical protein Q8L86_12555 [Vicinamibacterales bacterium]|nr:hypothetical protein [Vicinamibacterales bacterium]